MKTLQSQLSDKDADLAVLKGDLEGLRSELSELRVSEPTRFEKMKTDYLRSDPFVNQFTDRVMTLFDNAIQGTLQQLQQLGHAPANLPTSVIDDELLTESIPEEVFGYFE